MTANDFFNFYSKKIVPICTLCAIITLVFFHKKGEGYMSVLGFLFNCDEHHPTLPDKQYAQEYNYLVSRGVRVFLFDFSEIQEGEQLNWERAAEKTYIVYRGWMLNEFQYDRLYDALKEKNYEMIVDPYCYRECHYLNYWYPKLQRLTAKSVYSHGLVDDKAIMKMLAEFGNKSVIVKDYVKSRKHEWYESCFIEDASNTEKAMEVIHHFIERQADKFSGGLVLREYLDIIQTGVHFESRMPISEEIRIYCYKGEPICFISYWSGGMVQMDKSFIEAIDKCAILDSPFYTIDLAKKTDDTWVLIEVGDGQVSHLRGYDISKFYDCFLSLLVRDYDVYRL